MTCFGRSARSARWPTSLAGTPASDAQIGAEIAARISDVGFDDLDAPIRRLNGAHTPTPYSPPLEKAVVPNQDMIARAIRDLVAE